MSERIFRVGCDASSDRFFENGEDTLWGGVRRTSRRICAYRALCEVNAHLFGMAEQPGATRCACGALPLSAGNS